MVMVNPECIEYNNFAKNKEYRVLEEDHGEFREGSGFPPTVTDYTTSYYLEDDTGQKVWVDGSCFKLVKKVNLN